MTKLMTISKGGQISLPAEIRKRWETEEVLVRDEGGHVEIWPVPADPLTYLMGRFPLPPGVTADGLRHESRADEAASEDRKAGGSGQRLLFVAE